MSGTVRLFMETTKISSRQTASQISALLGAAGATAVMTEFGPGGKIKAIAFQIELAGRTIPFRLPIRTGAIETLLRKRCPNRRDANERAERVAWRQVYRWVQAQLALVETEMVDLAEVFLAYVQVGIDTTLYQRLRATRFEALPEPKE